MYNIEYYYSLIKSAFSKLSIPSSPESLYEPLRYSLSMNGKRIRPLLCLISCDLCNGDVNKAIPAALSLELFHNFTLIHDDIMDNANLRRGYPTVYKKWGINSGILSGDVMFAISYFEISKSVPELVNQLVSILTQTAIQVCEGQQYDLDFENKQHISTEEYLEMIRLKTAALIAASLKMGAIIANADEILQNKFYSFGEKIGLAFQIQDDLLDAYGDANKFGKTIGNDITTNKKTYLYVKAYEDADEEQKNKLIYLYSGKEINSVSKINEVLTIFNKLDILNKTKLKLNNLYEEAFSILEIMEISNTAKVFLKDFVSQLINREA